MRRNKKIPNLCLILILTVFNVACSNKSQQQVEYQQSYDSGKAFYEDECQKCHMLSGVGLALLYPPLANSDYLKMNENDLTCIIYKGMKGPIIVNGKKFNWPMPPLKNIDEIKMSAILTYVRNAWGVSKGAVSFREARAMMDACGD